MSESHAIEERHEGPQVTTRREFLAHALVSLAAPTLAGSAVIACGASPEPAQLAPGEEYGARASAAGLKYRRMFGFSGDLQPEHLWRIIRFLEPALVIRRGDGHFWAYLYIDDGRGVARLPVAVDPDEDVWLLAWAVTSHLFRDLPASGVYNCPTARHLTECFLDGLEGFR